MFPLHQILLEVSNRIPNRPRFLTLIQVKSWWKGWVLIRAYDFNFLSSNTFLIQKSWVQGSFQQTTFSYCFIRICTVNSISYPFLSHLNCLICRLKGKQKNGHTFSSVNLYYKIFIVKYIVNCWVSARKAKQYLQSFMNSCVQFFV